MKVIFSKEVRAEAGYIIFRSFISKDGKISGQKVSVPESCIVEIWPDEKPLQSSLNQMRTIHGMLRNKIENNDFSINPDGAIHVSI
jgi:hypothetical protein